MFFSRPSSSVSANSWMSASGVFRSCDTLETKFDFSSARRTSRAAARATKNTPSAITPASTAIIARCGRARAAMISGIVWLP